MVLVAHSINVTLLYCLQDAASLAVAILKKKFRGRIFLGCDNHPLSRFLLNICIFFFFRELIVTSLCILINLNLIEYLKLHFISVLSKTYLLCCRQEIMDLINKSGKYDQKFEGFTGKQIYSLL